MAEFKVPILMVDAILPIENANAIELVQVRGYQTIVRKGDFVAGEPIVYIPEGSIVPDAILEELGLIGKLAGSNHNRVKAIKLRGCLSQGLAYRTAKYKIPWDFIGEDVSELLGITKWEPPVPQGMAGEVCNIHGYTIHYDIEPLKMYPNVLNDDEWVYVTSKLHGTLSMIGWHPNLVNNSDLFTNTLGIGGYFVASKGLGAKGLVFKNNNENTNNLYVRTAKRLNLFDQVQNLYLGLDQDNGIIVFGEIFGEGVQDLTYGVERGRSEFRVFDIYCYKTKSFIDADKLNYAISTYSSLQQVPVIYSGPYNKNVLNLVDQRENVSGKEMHIGEGIVIVPETERYNPEIGRVKVKVVSEKYLLRKGDVTEYN